MCDSVAVKALASMTLHMTKCVVVHMSDGCSPTITNVTTYNCVALVRQSSQLIGLEIHIGEIVAFLAYDYPLSHMFDHTLLVLTC